MASRTRRRPLRVSSALSGGIRRSKRAAPVINRPDPQPWFLDLTPRVKLSRERELRETLKLVRKLFTGFEATDGFDGRYPRNWTLQRRRQLEKFGYVAKTLTSSPSLIIKPRTSAQRIALVKHTGQVHPRQLRFVVHVPAPARAQVRFVRDRARVPFMGAAALLLRTLRVEVVDKVARGELYTRDFLFREVLGYQPVRWDEFQEAMRRLLPYLPDTTPSGAEALYTLLSEPHGPISSPVLKRFLLSTMEEWAEAYDDSFAGVLVGVRYQGDLFKSFTGPVSEYNERQRIRGVFKDIKEEYQRALGRFDRDQFRRSVAELREARRLQRQLVFKKKRAKKQRKPSSRARVKRAKARHK